MCKTCTINSRLDSKVLKYQLASSGNPSNLAPNHWSIKSVPIVWFQTLILFHSVGCLPFVKLKLKYVLNLTHAKFSTKTSKNNMDRNSLCCNQ